MNIDYYFYPFTPVSTAMKRLWFTPDHFPTPGIPLVVKLKDGSEQNAIRPSYVTTYKADPNFRDLDDNLLTEVVAWAIY